MPGLTIEEKKRKAERPPEIEEEALNKRKHKRQRKFDELFQALVLYKEEHSHCSVPLRYPEDRALGLWVVSTRNNQGSRLTPNQKERLTLLGFDWETREEKDERRWNEMFQKLKLYRRDHGDCKVPQTWATDPKLAKWVSAQRTKESNNKLSDNRKEKLDSIDFTWRQRIKARDTSYEDKKWLKHYKKLVEFHGQHGHCRVKAESEQVTWWMGWQAETNISGRQAER